MAAPEDNNDLPEAGFSRGMSGPFGKFDHGVVKTHLDELTYNRWLRLCAEKEVTSSELLRDILYLVVHQKIPAEFTADDRRGLLVGEGPSAALSRIGSR